VTCRRFGDGEVARLRRWAVFTKVTKRFRRFCEMPFAILANSIPAAARQSLEIA